MQRTRQYRIDSLYECLHQWTQRCCQTATKLLFGQLKLGRSFLSKFCTAFPLKWFFNWMKCVHAMIPGNWDTIIMKWKNTIDEQLTGWSSLKNSVCCFVVALTFVIFPRFSLQLVSLFKKCGSRHPVVRLYWNIYQHLNLKEMYEHVSVNTIGNPGKTRSWKKNPDKIIDKTKSLEFIHVCKKPPSWGINMRRGLKSGLAIALEWRLPSF